MAAVLAATSTPDATTEDGAQVEVKTAGHVPMDEKPYDDTPQSAPDFYSEGPRNRKERRAEASRTRSVLKMMRKQQQKR